MKRTIPFLSGLFFSCISYAQAPEIEWQNTIGGNHSDHLRQIVQTFDNGYIIGGYSNSDSSGDKSENSVSYDYWVVKLDSIGNIEWQNTLSGENDDYLTVIEQTSEGGYIAGGYSFSDSSYDKTDTLIGLEGTCDFWIVKLNSLGNIEWQNTIGGANYDFLRDLNQTSDGGYIVGGASNSGISSDKTELCIGGYDYWIIKLNSLGNIEWQNTIGGTYYDNLNTVEQTIDNGYILGGSSYSEISGDKTEPCESTGYPDFWVVKVDSSGNIEWQNTIGGNSNDDFNYIHQTIEKGYILSGTSYSSASGDKTENLISPPFPDYWVVKLDSNGVIKWQNDIGGSNTEQTPLTVQTTDEGYVVCGWSDSETSGDKSEDSMGEADYWILKLDTNGIIIWENTIGGTEDDLPYEINQTYDEGYIVGGYSSSGITGDKTEELVGLEDYWIVKLSDECEFTIYFQDADGDGYGNNLVMDYSCEPILGYVTNSDDCDDTNIEINPDAEEICNGIDENCNGINNDGLPLYTYYYDSDEDGYGNSELFVLKCFDIPPPGFVTDSSDCDDSNELIYGPVVYYHDADGDLFGDIFDNLLLCDFSAPKGYVIDNTDCDDENAMINSSQDEICNNIDDNCNIYIDEDLFLYTLYVDADNDNYGNPLIDSITCYSVITGYVFDSTDCNDENPLIYPGATEVLNGLDDNCNDTIDEYLNNITLDDPSSFVIYPNPNKGSFMIFQNITLEEIIVKVYDVLGNTVFEKQYDGNYLMYVRLPEFFIGIANVTISYKNMSFSKIIEIIN